MATETETMSLSLPATTAPTDFTDATFPPRKGFHAGAQQQSHPSDNDWETLDWDTNIVPTTGFPTAHGAGAPGAAASAAASGTRGGLHQHQGDHWQCECDDDKSGGGIGKSMEESCKRALDHFPSPAVDFPRPALEFDFRLAVTLKPEPSRVDARRACAVSNASAAGPGSGAGAAPGSASAAAANAACADKEITTISSGRWSGSFGNGRVMAGGYDLGQARGFRPIRIVEGAFVMQTTDEPPAILEMRTRGSLSGPSDVLDALLSPRQPKQIDPRRYGFRMFSTIKTADKRYAEIVNCGLWVASGVWKGDEMIIDAYRVT